jgi:hypothetical protein
LFFDPAHGWREKALNMIKRSILFTVAIVCGASSITAQVTVNGKIMWQDRNGLPHPLQGAKIEVWDNDAKTALGAPETFTDAAGQYSIQAEMGSKNTINIVLKVLSQSLAGSVHPTGLSQVYEFDSTVHNGLSPGVTVTVNLTGNSGEVSNQAFSVLEAIVFSHLYVESFLKQNLHPIPVNFPIDGPTVCGGAVSCFKSADPSLNILLLDRWDWDVVMHEYGHYVSKQSRLDQNPGGLHYIDSNLENIYDKDTAIRLAWGEGWPTFFSISAQNALNLKVLNVPNVGDTHYTDTEDNELDEDLASQNPDKSMGEDNELSVSRILFFLVEGIGTSRGNLKVSDKMMWDALTAQPISTLSDSWSALTQNKNREQASSIGNLYAEHLAAPSLAQPADGPIGEQPMTFTWKANGGGTGQTGHPNSVFRLFVFDAQWNTVIDSGDLSVNTFTPSVIQWGQLTKTHNSNFFWIVTGKNPDQPSTGPYASYAGKIAY